MGWVIARRQHLLAGIAVTATFAAAGGVARASSAATPIQHVIVIMQENRSFDSYFGTYPGADGIPAGTCQPISPTNSSLGCVVPFHDLHDTNDGGPHDAISSQASLDDGITKNLMDGFVQEQVISFAGFCKTHKSAGICNGTATDGYVQHDVMGTHTAAELPNYWAYAQHFVLQDHMFSGLRTWSYPNHLQMASEWAAVCSNPALATTCVTTNETFPRKTPVLPWANLFQLLDVNKVSWKWYLGAGTEPDCDDDDMTCPPQIQAPRVFSIFNPAPSFAWVKAQGAAYLKEHNPSTDQLLLDLKNGTLPQVAWVVPAWIFSEHPNAPISTGMEFVTSIVNAVMQSPYWANTAIFITWDDYGGFYDHERPPNVDTNPGAEPIQGYGIRVPGLMISAYANPGMIDHAVYSVDAYATLFENLFMNGARLDPAALGNPDSRPTIRDALTTVSYPDGTTQPVGQLINEFDFTQTPLPPLVLSTHMPAGIVVNCRNQTFDQAYTCTKKTVTITFDAVTGPEIAGPFTYHVTRNGTDLPQCVGTATTCLDTPPPGQYFYQVYSVDANNVASPTYGAGEADVPVGLK